MRIPTTVAALLLLQFGLLTDQASAITGAICNYKMFPVFAGGSKDEYVNTVEIDMSQKYILIGGKT